MIKRDLLDIRTLSVPRLPCPTCKQGWTLNYPDNNIKYYIDPRCRNDPDCFGPDEVGIFQATARCDNPSCHQVFSLDGDYKLEEWLDQENGWEWTNTIYINHLFPAVEIINLPVEVPETIRENLERSFSLFWSDIGACANAIRASIEAVMDYLKVPKEADKKDGSKRFRQLYERLVDIKASHPNLWESSDKIRGVGNSGSHGKAPDRTKILDSFELLEIEITALFSEGRRKDLLSKL